MISYLVSLVAPLRGGSRVWKGGGGGVHFAQKLKSKKKKKGHSNNLPNIFTIKYIKIFIQILIHSFIIVKLHCLMNTVTALLE